MIKIKGLNRKIRRMKEKRSTKGVIEHIEMREGLKIPLTSNAMFKTMFMSEKRLMYSAKLISYFLEDISYEYLLKNLHFTKNDISKNRNKDKTESADYVAKLGEDLIGIEVNNNASSWNLERNIEYASRQFAEEVVMGSKYKYRYVVQLNLNNFTYDEEDEEGIKIASLVDSDGMLLTDKLIFIQIYIPNIKQKWYNKGVEALDEKEKYIMALVEPNLSLIQELGDEEVMRKYIKEAEELSYDHTIIREYDKEFALRDEGRQEGKIDGKIEIVISMLKKGLNIKMISECTDMSIEEIEEIKEKEGIIIQEIIERDKDKEFALRDEGRQEGKIDGKIEKQTEIVISMLKKGLNIKMISEYTDIPIEWKITIMYKEIRAKQIISDDKCIF